MPNQINPYDYNIDFFASESLGVTTSTDFRDYLLNKNLTSLPDELVNGAAGNFTTQYQDKGVAKSINYTQISDPGNLDEWYVNGNFSVTSHEVRDINMLLKNEYGPAKIESYSYGDPQLIDDSTGFLQYQTSAGGDDYMQILLNDQLVGLGPGAAINFPSDLDTKAKERRKEEALNRLKLKGETTALGALNLDPFSLLSGTNLVLKDYKITAYPTVLGKLFESFTDTADITIPVSPIPYGAFGKYGDDDGPEIYSDLMKSTGSGTKSLIYNSVAVNKYGPTLNDPKGLLANVFGAGQAAQKSTYLTPPQDFINLGIEIPLIDKINKGVGKVFDSLAKAQIDSNKPDSPPTEFDNPTISLDSIQQNSEYGFDTLPSGGEADTWNLKGPLKKIDIPLLPISIPIPDDGPDGPIGTKIPLDVDEEFYPGNAASNGSKNNGKPYDRGMYWGSHTSNPFRKGILKYTQDLINNSKNTKDFKDKARYIGVANDASNYDSTTGRHKNYSMGNTVTNEENKYYCRSWSVRNPYRKVSDLVRHGGGSNYDRSLTREDLKLSVLDDNGFVKVAPYVGDLRGGFENGELLLGNPAVQKYMLSIENLAWQNTEHILNVPNCEVGPNGGRIMWFPPYNINFTDNSSVNWDATNFIGRGEPVYTYNNTERTGTLSFTLIIDHSMAMTEIKKEGEQALLRYFAGCENPLEAFTAMVPKQLAEDVKTQQKEENKETKTETPPPKKETIPFKPSDPAPAPGPIQFYFRNARYFEKDKVGTNLATELGPNADEKPPNYKSNRTKNWPNGYLRSPLNNTAAFIISNTFDPFTEPTIVPNPAYTATTQNTVDSLNEKAYQKMYDLIEFLLSPDGKRYKIKIVGKTSDAGPEKGKKSNEKLAEVRAKSTKDYLLNAMLEVESTLGESAKFKATNLGSEKTYPTESEWKDNNLRWEVLAIGETDSVLSTTYDEGTGQTKIIKDNNRVFGDSDTSVPSAIIDRTTLITLEYNKEIDDTIIGPQQAVDPNATTNLDATTQTTVATSNVTSTSTSQVQKEETVQKISDDERLQNQRQQELLDALTAKASRYLAWECSYFEKMKQEDSFIYESLTEKLKYFHPAFHSMTPEGFNARLTFLKQCTRQGPNIAVGEPSNLAFGKPPVCVLRIGDFYHTKIIIDSVNFSFDPLQWDLNPEGIGVQPMLCNVDLNFKFIGGSSLGGPITQLQNAVSFNFFANTALYNPRKISKSVGEYKVKRPDPLTGKIVVVAEKVKTYNAADSNFEYGAYMTPLQSFKAPNLTPQGSQEKQLDPNKGSVVGDASKGTLENQMTDQGIVAKNAETSQEEKDKVQAEVNNNNKNGDSGNNGNKGASNENKAGNENKQTKGFDKKKGTYTTQSDQILKWKAIGKNDTQTYKTLKIPKGTTIYIGNDTDFTKQVFIGKVKNPTTGKEFYNKVTLNCGRGDFSVKPVTGLQENPNYTGAIYTDKVLSDVILPIFCKGNKPKTWAELVA